MSITTGFDFDLSRPKVGTSTGLSRNTKPSPLGEGRSLNMGTITITNLGKAYKQDPTRWSRLAEWVLARQHVTPQPATPAERGRTALKKLIVQDTTLINQLRGLIESARQQALRAVDTIQVRTCWEIGRHIVEFEQQGAERASYGTRLIPNLAATLTIEFGRGFDERNLRHMRAFFQSFPIWNAVRTELSWIHYRTLPRVENEQARHWHMEDSASQNWSSRALEIKGLYNVL